MIFAIAVIILMLWLGFWPGIMVGAVWLLVGLYYLGKEEQENRRY